MGLKKLNGLARRVERRARGRLPQTLWVRNSSRLSILVGMTERDGGVTRSLFALVDKTRPSYRCKIQTAYISSKVDVVRSASSK